MKPLHNVATKDVTRVEIACPGGITWLWDARYSAFTEKPSNVSVELQDDGRTLRVFIDTQDARRSPKED